MRVGSISKHYPETVQQFVDPIVSVLIEGLTQDVVNPLLVEKELCDLALSRFLSDGNIYFNQDEVRRILHTAMTETLVDAMIVEGYVDSIETEDGEEIMWLTEKGKTYIKNNNKT